MATATIVTVRRKGGTVRCHAYVDEGGQAGRVEYYGETPLRDAAGNIKDAATLKEELRLAIKAQRDLQTDADAGVAGITGTITV